MRRATAVNLVLLGGGLTLIGTLSVVSERHRTQACLERQAHEPPGGKEDCRTSRSGGGGGHGGGGGGGGYGSGEDEGHSSTGAEVARGGFGGSGGEGGGE